MPLRCLLASALLLILAGCQAPAPVAPTALPSVTSVAPSPTAPPVGTSRVDTLNAANAAFARGDAANASGLYERVLNTPPTGEQAATSSAINQFQAALVDAARSSTWTVASTMGADVRL